MKVTKGRLSLPETAKCKEQIRCGNSVALLSEESIMLQTRPTVQHELHCGILLCSILARNDEACFCRVHSGPRLTLQILELCKHYLTLDVSIWSTVTFGCWSSRCWNQLGAPSPFTPREIAHPTTCAAALQHSSLRNLGKKWCSLLLHSPRSQQCRQKAYSLHESWNFANIWF